MKGSRRVHSIRMKEENKTYRTVPKVPLLISQVYIPAIKLVEQHAQSMSSYYVLSSSIHWGGRYYILTYLTYQEVYFFGCTNKAAFIVFQRERKARKFLRKQSTIESPFISHFLGKYHRRETVALVSYPRSGNSYLRSLLERQTGVITGSDNRTNRTLSASLLESGFLGEGVVDESVWIVKSHFPERLGYLKFPSHRVILLVRNPFDAILSYFHMAFTNTHNQRLSPAAFASLQHIWHDFIEKELHVWCSFYSYWLAHFERHHVPVLITRYEDCITHCSVNNTSSLL